MKATSKASVTYGYSIKHGRPPGNRKRHLCWLTESANTVADTGTWLTTWHGVALRYGLVIFVDTASPAVSGRTSSASKTTTLISVR